MKTLSKFTTSAVLCLVACGCGIEAQTKTQEHWDETNDPLNLSTTYQRVFSRLPIEGEVAVAPWSDSYWPSKEGGIANRWREVGSDAFSYALYTHEELQAMSRRELARLSPAEKYDAYVGNFDFPLVQSERSRTSPEAESWEGICHGWAPASINFSEPKSVLLESPSGLSIPFASSDVKALLSYYEGEIASSEEYSLGARCNTDIQTNPGSARSPECRDTNAGAFHITLANQIGLDKAPFVADVVRDLQVWNHPIKAYKSTIVRQQRPSRGAAAGTVREIVLKTKMTFSVEISPEWAARGPNLQEESTREYDYRLELNDKGEIIGGEWLSDGRPDFLWKQSQPTFVGRFAALAEIYEKSLSGPELQEGEL